MKIKNLLRQNIWAITLSTIVSVLYLYAMMKGNAFCDCAKTEKEKISTAGRAHGGRTFFYHK